MSDTESESSIFCGFKPEIVSYIGGIVHIICYLVLMITLPNIDPIDPLFPTLEIVFMAVYILSSLGIALILTTIVGTFVKKDYFLVPWMIYGLILILLQAGWLKILEHAEEYPRSLFLRDAVYTLFSLYYFAVIVKLYDKFTDMENNNRMRYEPII